MKPTLCLLFMALSVLSPCTAKPFKQTDVQIKADSKNQTETESRPVSARVSFSVQTPKPDGNQKRPVNESLPLQKELSNKTQLSKEPLDTVPDQSSVADKGELEASISDPRARIIYQNLKKRMLQTEKKTISNGKTQGINKNVTSELLSASKGKKVQKVPDRRLETNTSTDRVQEGTSPSPSLLRASAVDIKPNEVSSGEPEVSTVKPITDSPKTLNNNRNDSTVTSNPETLTSMSDNVVTNTKSTPSGIKIALPLTTEAKETRTNGTTEITEPIKERSSQSSEGNKELRTTTPVVESERNLATKKADKNFQSSPNLQTTASTNKVSKIIPSSGHLLVERLNSTGEWKNSQELQAATTFPPQQSTPPSTTNIPALSASSKPKIDHSASQMKDLVLDLPQLSDQLNGEPLINETLWAQELASAAHPDEENTIHDPCAFISETIHRVVGMNVSKEQVHSTLPTFKFLLTANTEELTTIKDTLLTCVEASTNKTANANAECQRILSLIRRTCEGIPQCKGKEDTVMTRAMKRIREVIDSDQLADALLMLRACAGQTYEY
ncbi:unnamed protein product [Calicophoron daubneyi]|uniref:Uncharacterized protein n=1 Tax=Calicophoron daubneyi TaxID=300641 RepID=A0AAV2T0B3_CALDB